MMGFASLIGDKIEKNQIVNELSLLQGTPKIRAVTQDPRHITRPWNKHIYALQSGAFASKMWLISLRMASTETSTKQAGGQMILNKQAQQQLATNMHSLKHADR